MHVGTAALGCPVEQGSTPTRATSNMPGITVEERRFSAA